MAGISKNKRPYTPTAEQIQLANERRAKRLAQKTSATLSPPDFSYLILPRKWLPANVSYTPIRARITIMTWNMLAQCLIRRDLFPGSDCLKSKDREQMLSAEILNYSADIVCLQEVDRLDTLLPSLCPYYDNIYAAGRDKLHGLYYDEEPLISGSSDGTQKFGATRRTRNIGLIAALRHRNDNSSTSQSDGCIVATTHLFWHPKFCFERSRQAFILLRETIRFRSSQDFQRWPIFFGGDFNSQPSEPTYSLLVGQHLLDTQKAELESSRVIHVSVDHSIGTETQEWTPEDENETHALDEDSGHAMPPITNHRRPIPADEVPAVGALESMYSCLPGSLRSMYDEARIASETFGQRNVLSGKGGSEPMWTSFTPLWRLTLDYLFIWDGPHNVNEPRPEVLSVLEPHKTQTLEPGLPRKGICASDHVALIAEVGW